MSADPLGGSVDVPQSLNRYLYAANDPVDPLGLTALMAVVTYCETPYWVQTYSDGHTNVLWGSPVCWTDTLMTETPDSLMIVEPLVIGPGGPGRDPKKKIEDLRAQLWAALLNDPDCLSFLGARGVGF